MEKTSEKMDLDEWEYISDDGFLDFQHPEDGGKRLFTREIPKGVLDTNYFICPSPTSRQIFDTPKNSSVSRGGNQLVPIPIRLEPVVGKTPDHELVKEVAEVPIIEINMVPPAISEKITVPNSGAVTADQDRVSQVFFKKMKENEFVDMKMDSPKSSSKGVKPQTEVGSIQFEDKEDTYKGEVMEHKTSSNVETEQEMVKKNNDMDSKVEEESNWEGGAGGLSIWKWRLSGIGALCSIGVAAATLCIFFFGSHQRHKHQHSNQLGFQIYAGDKKIKQVVNHSTMNQALSAVRGVPFTRANICFGGYYDGL